MFEKYLNNRLFILYLFPFIIGFITVFSFEPFNFTIINFIVLPLFFYLIVFIKKRLKSVYRKKPFKKNLFIFGLMFGFGFYLSGVHWIANSLTFDEQFKILIPFALILIPLFLSLFFSLVTLIVGPFLNFNLSSIFLLSASLSVSDYIRSKILTGFPWNLWAYSFSWATEIIQIVSFTGMFAFNLLSITIFMVPVFLFFKRKLTIKIYFLFSIFFTLLCLYIFGNYSLNKNNIYLKSVEKNFHIKVISPNFPLNYFVNFEENERRLKKLIKYSEPNKKTKTLFVWPEGVFSGFDYSEILAYKELFLKNFSTNHYILFGVNRLDQKKGNYYNSMLVINNKMEILNQYNKRKLVPFGEFLPFENFLERYGFKKITKGQGSFLKGANQKNFIIEQLNILPLICYEIIFPELIQKSNYQTNLVINISEDGWFGNTIGPYQHFSKSIFRAIEQDSFLVRSTNKGISVIINNKGEVIKRLNPSEAGNIELTVPLVEKNKKNKNDLIFFIVLFTYGLFFGINKKNYVEK